MELLRQLVDDGETQRGRRFQLLIQFLIVLSLIQFSVKTLPNLPAWLDRLLTVSEFLIIILFTIEYVVRILVARNKRKFIFSFYGIVDFLTIAPFYLTIGLDFRAIRALRLLQLARVLKLTRYTRAMHRFHAALKIAREELQLYLFVSLILLYLAATGIYFFEHEAQPEKFASVFHSLWWAIATLTTVGYGDVYPITAGGRMFTFLILILGLGVVSVPAGLVASALSEVRERDAKDLASEQPLKAREDTENGD